MQWILTISVAFSLAMLIASAVYFDRYNTQNCYLDGACTGKDTCGKDYDWKGYVDRISATGALDEYKKTAHGLRAMFGTFIGISIGALLGVVIYWIIMAVTEQKAPGTPTKVFFW